MWILALSACTAGAPAMGGTFDVVAVPDRRPSGPVTEIDTIDLAIHLPTDRRPTTARASARLPETGADDVDGAAIVAVRTERKLTMRVQDEPMAAPVCPVASPTCRSRAP